LVIQLAKDWRQANITERDKAMLEFAEKMTLDAATMTEVDVQKLRKVDFSDEDILSIALLSAYRNFIVRIADALGCELQGETLGEDERIREALTTGKLI
jgi:uncharacterized peroxidase-related enzyme